MNYLGHYVFNHEICRLEPEPYFVTGVALPDLWPRFSRRRRIRWRCVRDASPSEPPAVRLRDGMLNHAAVDQRFHALPAFVGGQRELKARVASDGLHPALFDFLTHLSLELALDRWMVREDPQRAEDFYDQIARCEPRLVEHAIGTIAGVDTRGLAEEVRGFVRRRFLANFARSETLVRVAQYVLKLTSASQTPPEKMIRELLETAATLTEPSTIWSQMCQGETGCGISGAGCRRDQSGPGIDR